MPHDVPTDATPPTALEPPGTRATGARATGTRPAETRPPAPLPGTGSPVDPDALRRVLGSFPTGVTVVTSLEDGTPRGVTVSAFMSISLEPPLVLVALDQARSLDPVIQRTGAYAVNILGEDDAALSDCFAGAPVVPGRDALCGAAWHPGAVGMPILERAIASLECRLEQVVRLGDHDFLVGRVVSLAGGDDGAEPLLYRRRRYLRIERATSSPLEGNADH
jgi:3-hydroxy-9,10-secoandrosta-1,3,5(10)-triene-9,17-dione monooxygenase reductase component